MSSQAIELSKPLDAVTVERVLVGGDLSKLSPAERVNYYARVCESLGLNPLTRPFEYILLNNRLTLYAKRDCTDQLRAKHKISVESLETSQNGDLYIVVAHGVNSEGRRDTGTGVVYIAGLKGDALANAIMKAETKAKRRLTLSICGLGILDETEVETIPDAHPDSAPEPIRPTTKKSVSPQAEVASPGKDKPQPASGDVKYINEGQLKRLFAIQGAAGMSDDTLKKWLAAKGVHSRKLIPVDLYNETIDYIDPEFAHHERPENF